MDIRGRPGTVFVLSGGVLSTEFMPDTEEVTGSIPVSPTNKKRPLTCGNAESEDVFIWSYARYVPDPTEPPEPIPGGHDDHQAVDRR